MQSDAFSPSGDPGEPQRDASEPVEAPRSVRQGPSGEEPRDEGGRDHGDEAPSALESSDVPSAPDPDDSDSPPAAPITAGLAGEHATAESPRSSGGFGRVLRAFAAVFGVLTVSGFAYLLTSVLVMILATIWVTGSFGVAKLQEPETMKQVVGSRVAFPLMVIIPQVALVLPAVAAALVGVTRQTPMTRRLGLTRGHWPLWAWGAAAFAAPLVGMISGVICGLFLEESDQLREMSDIFREHGQSGFLIPLALIIGLTPAICEELLFRGFVQTRLTAAIGPTFGILLASVCFAVFHFDPVHVVAVFPIGLFLGWVSWQSGSLFPAMFGHFVNNAISVVGVVMAPEAEGGTLSVPSVLFALFIFGAGILGTLAVVLAGYLYRPQERCRDSFSG